MASSAERRSHIHTFTHSHIHTFTRKGLPQMVNEHTSDIYTVMSVALMDLVVKRPQYEGVIKNTDLNEKPVVQLGLPRVHETVR
jgi:hypothetical protein